MCSGDIHNYRYYNTPYVLNKIIGYESDKRLSFHNKIILAFFPLGNGRGKLQIDVKQ